MARCTGYFHYLIDPLLYFWSWDSKWPPRILRQSPWPRVPDCSPDLSFIQGVQKVAHHLLEGVEGMGLDLTYLWLKNTPSLKNFQCPSVTPTDDKICFYEEL